MRCTAPMNAPAPPPTMPKRMRGSRPPVCVVLPSIVTPRASASAREPEDAAIRRLVRARVREVVERALRHADDVLAHELSALARAVLGVLQAALPLDDGPAVEIVGRELREDAVEVDLAVARRAEAARAIDPALVAAVDALSPRRIELGVLDVKHADALVVNVDVLEIVEALQHVVRRVEQHAGPRVPARALVEHLVRHAVVQVFAGVNLVADVDAAALGVIE